MPSKAADGKEPVLDPTEGLEERRGDNRMLMTPDAVGQGVSASSPSRNSVSSTRGRNDSMRYALWELFVLR